jgi:hypothetical protein
MEQQKIQDQKMQLQQQEMQQQQMAYQQQMLMQQQQQLHMQQQQQFMQQHMHMQQLSPIMLTPNNSPFVANENERFMKVLHMQPDLRNKVANMGIIQPPQVQPPPQGSMHPFQGVTQYAIPQIIMQTSPVKNIHSPVKKTMPVQLAQLNPHMMAMQQQHGHAQRLNGPNLQYLPPQPPQSHLPPQHQQNHK